MKASGIIRNVDNLGRFVLPSEIRESLGVKDGGGAFEIFIGDDDSIILKKYEPSCTFCGNCEDIITYKQKNVCKSCVEKINIISRANE